MPVCKDCRSDLTTDGDDEEGTHYYVCPQCGPADAAPVVQCVLQTCDYPAFAIVETAQDKHPHCSYHLRVFINNWIGNNEARCSETIGDITLRLIVEDEDETTAEEDGTKEP